MPTSTGQGSQLHHDEHQKRLHPPFAQPDPGRRATPNMSAEAPTEGAPTDFPDSIEPSVAEVAPSSGAVESLPSIDRFVDDLPSIDDFLLEPSDRGVGGLPADPAYATRGALPAKRSDTANVSEGWAEADWQSFDWSRLASLGAPAPEAAEAHAAWSTTNWDAGQAPSDEHAYLNEAEVAAALEEIARKIRTGELSLHQFRGSPPEAAIAAAFASLLRSRG